MGKNGLGKVFLIAGRSCLFFLSFGQSHFKHTKNILVTEKNLLKNTIQNGKTAANMNCVKNQINFTLFYGFAEQ